MGEPAWTAMLRLGVPALLARSQVLDDVAVLAQPEGKAQHPIPSFRAQSASQADHHGTRGAHARTARRQQRCRGGLQRPLRDGRGGHNFPPAHQKRSALRCACGVGDRTDRGIVPIDVLAKRGRQIGSRPSSVAKVCTNVGQRKRSSEDTGGGVTPVLSGSSELARETNTLRLKHGEINT